MAQVMYICGDCGSSYSNNPGRVCTCDKCGKVLFEVNLSLEEWNSYDTSQKDDIRQQIISYAHPETQESNANTQNSDIKENQNEGFVYRDKSNNGDDNKPISGSGSSKRDVNNSRELAVLNEMLEEVKVIKHDLSFIYGCFVFYVIMTVIGVIVLLANL